MGGFGLYKDTSCLYRGANGREGGRVRHADLCFRAGFHGVDGKKDRGTVWERYFKRYKLTKGGQGMAAYTLKRLAAGIVSLFVLATATFFLVRLIPGSPFQNGGVSSQVVEAVEEEYGLNEPLLDQYITYMGNLIRGDLGVSYQEPGTSVAEVIKRTWPVTASLGAAALMAAVIFGTGLGILRAVSKYKAIREGIAAGGNDFCGDS